MRSVFVGAGMVVWCGGCRDDSFVGLLSRNFVCVREVRFLGGTFGGCDGAVTVDRVNNGHKEL